MPTPYSFTTGRIRRDLIESALVKMFWPLGKARAARAARTESAALPVSSVLAARGNPSRSRHGTNGFIVLNHNLQDFDKNASFRSAAADVSVKFKYTFRF
jgi:hypothetical protein